LSRNCCRIEHGSESFCSDSSEMWNRVSASLTRAAKPPQGGRTNTQDVRRLNMRIPNTHVHLPMPDGVGGSTRPTGGPHAQHLQALGELGQLNRAYLPVHLPCGGARRTRTSTQRICPCGACLRLLPHPLIARPKGVRSSCSLLEDEPRREQEIQTWEIGGKEKKDNSSFF